MFVVLAATSAARPLLNTLVESIIQIESILLALILAGLAVLLSPSFLRASGLTESGYSLLVLGFEATIRLLLVGLVTSLIFVIVGSKHCSGCSSQLEWLSVDSTVLLLMLILFSWAIARTWFTVGTISREALRFLTEGDK